MAKKFKLWDDIEWRNIDAIVAERQRRIYKASLINDQQSVITLQQELINSHEAKIVAVRTVTSLNRGKFTPGVDRNIITTGKQKWDMAQTLRLNGKAQPIRRVYIPKPGKIEKRPLGIPTITDRAKQALAKMALEPQWEAVFEENSYGFRPGRALHDAIEQVFCCVRINKRETVQNPDWILEADISKCFDEIDHDALLGKIEKLGTFPEMKEQIRAWLKAGCIEAFANRKQQEEAPENTKGTPQGGIISPLLANIALHGLENHLKEVVRTIPITKDKSNEARNRPSALGVVRYADDFVVISKYKHVIDQITPAVNDFLKTVGLTLSQEKTRITRATEGFDFLGATVITLKRPEGGYRVKIYPSRKSQEKHIASLRSVFEKARGWPTNRLIKILNPKIVGWSNHVRYWESATIRKNMDNAQWGMVRHWVYRKSNKLSKAELNRRYFSGVEYQTEQKVKEKGEYNLVIRKDKWVLTDTEILKNGNEVRRFLYKHSWIGAQKWVKVIGTKSPYDGDEPYWGQRLEKYAGLPREKCRLLKKQKRRCTYCEQLFNIGDIMNVDHIVELQDGGKDRFDNKQLLHLHCHYNKTRETAYARTHQHEVWKEYLLDKLADEANEYENYFGEKQI